MSAIINASNGSVESNATKFELPVFDLANGTNVLSKGKKNPGKVVRTIVPLHDPLEGDAVSFADLKEALKAVHPTLSSRAIGKLANDTIRDQGAKRELFAQAASIYFVRSGFVADYASVGKKAGFVKWVKPTAVKASASETKALSEKKVLKLENEALKSKLAEADVLAKALEALALRAGCTVADLVKQTNDK